MSGESTTGPLAGIRVIDLTRQGPGPMCSQVLAQLGCDVVKLERPAPLHGRRQNPWLESTRRQVRSLVLDLKKPAGQEVFARLAATAQVILEGFRPGVAARLGVDYEALQSAGLQVVYVSISGFGQTGPYSQRPGHDINYIALGGVLSVSGTIGGPPALPGVLVADFAAGGLLAVVAVLAGLHELRTTGQGQYVDLSMHDSVVHLMARFLVPYFENGALIRRGGDFLTGAAPWYGIYQTRDDGFVAVGAVEDHYYSRLVAHLGHPEWSNLQWDQSRWPELRTEMAAVFKRRDRDEWTALAANDACVAPVLDASEIALDQHLRKRRVVVADGGSGLIMGPVVPLRGALAPTGGPRQVGQDTDAVLGELGYAKSQVGELRESGVAY
jgi:alpha-methylacyl-CoA racemase